jgi:hypothetical protein
VLQSCHASTGVAIGKTAMKDVNYFLDHSDEFNALSESDQNALMDTGFLPVTVAAPVVEQGVAVTDGAPAAEAEVAPTTTTDATPAAEVDPVIMGKGGTHTIPYSALEEIRTEAHDLRVKNAQQEALILQLTQAQVHDDENGGTAATDAVKAEYEGLFPEVFGDIEPMVARMIDDRVKAALTQVESRVTPIENQALLTQQARNDAEILAAHPDAKDRLNEDAFDAWINDNPYIIGADKKPLDVMATLRTGSPTAINDVLSRYKTTLTPPVATTAPADLAAQAAAIVGAVKPKAPGTMSDLNGTAPAMHDELDAALAMAPHELEAKMMNMSADQMNKILARLT